MRQRGHAREAHRRFGRSLFCCFASPAPFQQPAKAHCFLSLALASAGHAPVRITALLFRCLCGAASQLKLTGN